VKLRGPHCLGRSVVVSPWQATPVDWSTARRIDVSKINSILNRIPDNDNVLKGLRRAWQEREAVIIECPDFRVPSNPGFDHFWDLEPISSPPLEELDFYVFANAVDLRDVKKPRFRPWDLALQSGAKRSDEADIIAPSGEHCWIDGGPLQVLEHEDLMGHGVIPRIHLQQKSFQTLHRASVLSSSLAADQIAAVQHDSGPARIIAPAGSGRHG
jgi:DNA helicase-2/ATP-dependent DNA helicase PcrA